MDKLEAMHRDLDDSYRQESDNQAFDKWYKSIINTDLWFDIHKAYVDAITERTIIYYTRKDRALCVINYYNKKCLESHNDKFFGSLESQDLHFKTNQSYFDFCLSFIGHSGIQIPLGKNITLVVHYLHNPIYLFKNYWELFIQNHS